MADKDTKERFSYNFIGKVTRGNPKPKPPTTKKKKPKRPNPKYVLR